MLRSLALAATALAVALTPASAAPAATLAPLKPCYVGAGPAESAREKIDVRAQGFTPNAAASVLIDGAVVLADRQIDQTGTLAGGVPVPYQASGQRLFTLTITEQGNAANTASAQSLVTALDVSVTPPAARPSSRVRFRGRGFTAGPAVYAHYLRKGRVRKTVRLATASGPCGTFDVRRRQLPIKHPHSGRWTVQVDQQALWSSTPTSAIVTLTIDVTRAPAGTSDPS